MAINLKRKTRIKKQRSKREKGKFRYLSVLIMVAICCAMCYNIVQYMNQSFNNYQVFDQLKESYIEKRSAKECYADILYCARVYYSATYQYHNMTRAQAREEFYRCRDIYEKFNSEEKMIVFAGKTGKLSNKVVNTLYSAGNNTSVMQTAISVQLQLEAMSPDLYEPVTLVSDGKKQYYYISDITKTYNSLNSTKVVVYDDEEGNTIMLEPNGVLNGKDVAFDYKDYLKIGYNGMDLYAGDNEVKEIYQRKYSSDEFNDGNIIRPNGENLKRLRIYVMENICSDNDGQIADVTATSHYKDILDGYKEKQKDLLVMYYMLAGMVAATALLFIYKLVHKSGHYGKDSKLGKIYTGIWGEIRIAILFGLIYLTVYLYGQGAAGSLEFLGSAVLLLIYIIPTIYLLFSLGKKYFSCSIIMSIHEYHVCSFLEDDMSVSRYIRQEGKKSAIILVVGSLILGVIITVCSLVSYENVFYLKLLISFTIIAAFFFCISLYSFFDVLNVIRRNMKVLEKQIESIGKGTITPDSKEQMIESSNFYLTRQLDQVQENLEEALNNRIRSERMKLDLVTNVSHDLKTPLTSIINYVDLLYDTEELSGEARDYVKVLRNKSYRLKSMIQDLFDLSKATSGNLEVEIGKINFTKLIQQTLGDMEDEIEKSNLIFKVSLIDDIMIESDGNRMYRVLQNLFVNVLKYAMPHTRVYVNMMQSKDKIQLDIKNVSKYELNFSENEVKERFFRGDSARSTAGSGLGVAIANSFTEVCGGKFDIRIDGDLFCACVKFTVHDK